MGGVKVLGGRPVTVRREEIPHGERGTRRTLEAMERFTARASADPRIIALSRAILRDVPAYDDMAEAAALHRWVQRRIKYRRDPYGIEFIADPVHTLTMRAGDCDDRSQLLAALLRSVGFKTDFMVSSIAPGGRPFQHVFPRALVRGVGWVALDPTRRLAPGDFYPGTTRAAVLSGGGFRDMMTTAARKKIVARVRVPRRMATDPAIARSLGLRLGDDGNLYAPIRPGENPESLEGIFGKLGKALKKGAKGVRKLSKVQPLKAIKRARPLKIVRGLAKLAPIGLIPGGPAGAALIKAAIAAKPKQPAATARAAAVLAPRPATPAAAVSRIITGGGPVVSAVPGATSRTAAGAVSPLPSGDEDAGGGAPESDAGAPVSTAGMLGAIPRPLLFGAVGLALFLALKKGKR